MSLVLLLFLLSLFLFVVDGAFLIFFSCLVRPSRCPDFSPLPPSLPLGAFNGRSDWFLSLPSLFLYSAHSVFGGQGWERGHFV